MARKRSWISALAGSCLLVASTAGAVCDDFMFFQSFACSSSAHCIQVAANASGGGAVSNDFAWMHGSDPVEDSRLFESNGESSGSSGGCTARSEIGTLRTSASADGAGSRRLGISSSGSCYAMFRITDLIFTGAPPSVQTTLWLELDGVFSAEASGDSETNAMANSVVTVRGSVCQADGTPVHSFAGDRDRLADHRGDESSQTIEREQSGLLMEQPSGMLEVGPFIAPTNEALQLELEITVAAIVTISRRSSADPNGTASARSQYGDTFGFPSEAPAFEVPEGFGVSSVQAGIQIPEPHALPSLLAGLASVGVLQRRARIRV